APFRMFQHICTTDEQLSLLRNVCENLESGGKFIMDVFKPNLEMISKGMEETLQFEGEYLPGKTVKRFHKAQPDILNQVQNVTFRFEWDSDKGKKESKYSFPMRYFFRYELEHLIARSGLKLENIYGDFNENPLAADSKSFVVVCSK